MYVSFSLSPSEGGVVIYRAWVLSQESLIWCMWLTKAQPAYDDLHSLISIIFIHSLKSIIANVIAKLTRCNCTFNPIETPFNFLQSRPRSGSSYKSYLIRVYSVCFWKHDKIISNTSGSDKHFLCSVYKRVSLFI